MQTLLQQQHQRGTNSKWSVKKKKTKNKTHTQKKNTHEKKLGLCIGLHHNIVLVFNVELRRAGLGCKWKMMKS